MGRMGGKVVVVTGAGNGLGREYAMALAAEGAKVLVNDVGRALVGGEKGEGLGLKPPGGAGLVSTPPDISVAQRVVDEITAAGGEAVANDADVSSVDSAASVVYAAADAFGDVDVVVNNAGTYHAADVEDVDDARLDAEFAVHVKGTAGTTKAAFEVMKRNGHGGSIVNIMSNFGGVPAGPDLAVYNAAKHGVASWTLSTAQAGSPYGIRANAFCPAALTRQAKGYMVKAGFAPDDPETVKRFGPDKMVPLVLFLASDASRELNGRLFLFLPNGFGPDGEYVLNETFVVETDGVARPAWTVEEIERQYRSFTCDTDRQGKWNTPAHANRYE